MNNIPLRIVVVSLLLLASLLIDIFLLPGEVLPAAPYVVTLAVSAYLLDSRRMSLAGVAVVLVLAVSTIVQRYSPAVAAGTLLTTAITALLAYAITRQTEQEILLQEKADALERDKAVAEERVKLLAQVQAEKDRLSSLINSITDEVWFADTQKNFTLANPSALREFGLETNGEGIEVEKLAASMEVFRPDGTPRPVEEAPPLRALKGEMVTNQEEMVRTPKSGELRYRQVSAAPVRDAGGEIVGSVSVVRDVTELKTAEEQLRQRNKLLEHAPVLVRSMNDEIVLWNSGMEKLYGFSMAEALGKVSHNLLQTVHPQPVSEIRDIVMQRGQWEGELRHIRKDGTEVIVTSLQILHSNANGNPTAIVEVNNDITGRRRVEEERERLLAIEQVQNEELQSQSEELHAQYEELAAMNEELAAANGSLIAAGLEREQLLKQAEEAVRARDEFLSIASHELKTPLTSLLGYSQVLIRQMEKTESIDQERLSLVLQTIGQQSNKLANLINQLLDVSRIEAGKLMLDCQPADITSIVKEAITDAGHKGSQHEIVLNSPGRVEARVDAMRLEQVVANLIDNAMKYSPDTEPIEVEVTADNGPVQIVVTDHGVGVPPEHRDHIFDRFYQAQRHYPLGGLGLGLFISKQIVELHGGAITAEFPEDGGTRFIVTLPADTKDA